MPGSIQLLYGLSNLMLLNNHITSLPDEIGNMPRLVSIMVGSNDLVTVPESIGNLPYLMMLSLGSNARGIWQAIMFDNLMSLFIPQAVLDIDPDWNIDIFFQGL